MMIVQNPLTTYIAWLVDQDLNWADSIACNFFESWRTMDETKKLIDTSKEEYDAIFEAVRDYFDAIKRGEEGLVPPDLYWEKEEYDYGDIDNDADFLPGVLLKRLVSYLDKFVELNNRNYIVKIALQLFQHTDYMLLSYTIGKPPISLIDYHRNKYIESLLEGDLEKAEKEEHELHLVLEEKAALLATKASWDNFIKEDFNQAVILYYDKIRLYGI